MTSAEQVDSYRVSNVIVAEVTSAADVSGATGKKLYYYIVPLNLQERNFGTTAGGVASSTPVAYSNVGGASLAKLQNVTNSFAADFDTEFNKTFSVLANAEGFELTTIVSSSDGGASSATSSSSTGAEISLAKQFEKSLLQQPTSSSLSPLFLETKFMVQADLLDNTLDMKDKQTKLAFDKVVTSRFRSAVAHALKETLETEKKDQPLLPVSCLIGKGTESREQAVTSTTTTTTNPNCYQENLASFLPGRWELYMYKGGSAGNGYNDMRIGKNVNGLGTLCPHPTSGNAKMAEALFNEKCFRQILVVGGDKTYLVERRVLHPRHRRVWHGCEGNDERSLQLGVEQQARWGGGGSANKACAPRTYDWRYQHGQSVDVAV
eukprot:GSA120T00010159001.1